MAPDPLSMTFAALADPTRRAILARLALGETSVTELAEPFEISLPAISKHLKVLERAGLVARGREAQWRPRRLEAAPLREVADWVEHYRGFWEASLDRLDDYLKELQAKEKKRGRKK
jgi:DNA-binding transcriptional ArsR family regulator